MWHVLSHDSWSELRDEAEVSADARSALSQTRPGANIVASSFAIEPDLKLPSGDEEAADTKRADDTYEVCIARLRELTRNTTNFPLLFQENISYGFRRNLWAMKPAAIFIALLAIAVALSSLRLRPEPHFEFVMLSAVISALILTWSLFRITPTWVREAAERYADQLLWSCEQLVQQTSAPTPAGSRIGF